MKASDGLHCWAPAGQAGGGGGGGVDVAAALLVQFARALKSSLGGSAVLHVLYNRPQSSI